MQSLDTDNDPNNGTNEKEYNMLVTTLEEMEAIVSSRADMEWDGWSIVKYTKASNAMYSPDGCRVNGVWMKKKVFPLTEDGWYLPNSIGRVHAAVEG